VPVGDDPVRSGGAGVGREPGHHRTGGRSIGLDRTQHDEVKVSK